MLIHRNKKKGIDLTDIEKEIEGLSVHENPNDTNEREEKKKLANANTSSFCYLAYEVEA